MKPLAVFFLSAGAALFLNGCVQTSTLRIENHSRQPVLFFGPGEPEEATDFGNPFSPGHWQSQGLAPRETAEAVYHVRKTTGIVLPIVGGITSERGYGAGPTIHHGPWTLDLPSADQWKEPEQWERRSLYYRRKHESLGTLRIADKAADTVLITPDGLRLPVTRRKKEKD